MAHYPRRYTAGYRLTKEQKPVTDGILPDFCMVAATDSRGNSVRHFQAGTKYQKRPVCPRFQKRNANGGKTNDQNHAEVCKDTCHKELHSK